MRGLRWFSLMFFSWLFDWVFMAILAMLLIGIVEIVIAFMGSTERGLLNFLAGATLFILGFVIWTNLCLITIPCYNDYLLPETENRV